MNKYTPLLRKNKDKKFSIVYRYWKEGRLANETVAIDFKEKEVEYRLLSVESNGIDLNSYVLKEFGGLCSVPSSKVIKVTNAYSWFARIRNARAGVIHDNE